MDPEAQAAVVAVLQAKAVVDVARVVVVDGDAALAAEIQAGPIAGQGV